ncbi:MAG: tRNA guanosine(34) transglycosylase Tgt, partial [Eubacteriales bacterium]
MFTLLKTDGAARRGRMTTPHGTIETPVFMNVGTQAAIKGGLDAFDLERIGCQIELSNTYHLHVRPGEDVVRTLGGLHRFMNWTHPILTDSGGFQIFSLSSLRRITEEGVHFHSHVDGRKIFMGPEESMAVQSALGSDIAMAFDECVANPAERPYVEASVARTTRWLERCKTALDALNAREDAVNPGQMLFGINQGGTYDDIRVDHITRIAELGLAGYAVGGLAVGEPTEV